jgi:hypothetical protein
MMAKGFEFVSACENIRAFKRDQQNVRYTVRAFPRLCKCIESPAVNINETYLTILNQNLLRKPSLLRKD